MYLMNTNYHMIMEKFLSQQKNIFLVNNTKHFSYNQKKLGIALECNHTETHSNYKRVVIFY